MVFPKTQETPFRAFFWRGYHSTGFCQTRRKTAETDAGELILPRGEADPKLG